MSHQELAAVEVERRMAEAAQAEGQGSFRVASRLYDRLGKDIQARHGRYDSRALDAFEGVARTIRKSTEGCEES